jgi:ribosomal protein S12 methylthiotransferase
MPKRPTAPAGPPAGVPAVHVVTLGCPKNEVDSDRMGAALAAGFRLVQDADDADVVVVNTCSFIREATEESIEVVMSFATSWKAARPGRVLIVAGCMPSRYGDELASAMPEADAFVKVADEAAIASVVARLTGTVPTAPPSGPLRLAPGPSAYLQVSDGCHRACTFCAIPSIRGPYVSRSERELVAEAAALVAGGARELVLVGQDVSAWGRDLPGTPTLAGLVRALARTPGLAWLRLMYIQPDGVTPELLEVLTGEPTVVRYLDMPLQHASSAVLRRMGRPGDGAAFLRLVGVIRSAVPGIVLRTTLIAGFPGETAEEFETLSAFVRDAHLDYTGVFAFSPEEGTAAASLPGQVPVRTRRSRTQRLRDIADEVGAAQAAAYVGREIEVLALGSEDGEPFGRHRGQAPDVDGVVLLDREVEPGTIVSVTITDSLGYDLVGEVR